MSVVEVPQDVDLFTRLYRTPREKERRQKTANDALVTNLPSETLRWMKKRRSKGSTAKVALSHHRERQLREIFEGMDANGNGFIDLAELTLAIDYVRERIQHVKGLAAFQNIHQVFKGMDADGDGTVDFQEFTAAMTGTTKSAMDSASEHDIEKLFSAFTDFTTMRQRSNAIETINEYTNHGGGKIQARPQRRGSIAASTVASTIEPFKECRASNNTMKENGRRENQEEETAEELVVGAAAATAAAAARASISNSGSNTNNNAEIKVNDFEKYRLFKRLFANNNQNMDIALRIQAKLRAQQEHSKRAGQHYIRSFSASSGESFEEGSSSPAGPGSGSGQGQGLGRGVSVAQSSKGKADSGNGNANSSGSGSKNQGPKKTAGTEVGTSAISTLLGSEAVTDSETHPATAAGILIANTSLTMVHSHSFDFSAAAGGMKNRPNQSQQQLIRRHKPQIVKDTHAVVEKEEIAEFENPFAEEKEKLTLEKILENFQTLTRREHTAGYIDLKKEEEYQKLQEKLKESRKKKLEDEANDLDAIDARRRMMEEKRFFAEKKAKNMENELSRPKTAPSSGSAAGANAAAVGGISSGSCSSSNKGNAATSGANSRYQEMQRQFLEQNGGTMIPKLHTRKELSAKLQARHDVCDIVRAKRALSAATSRSRTATIGDALATGQLPPRGSSANGFRPCGKTRGGLHNGRNSMLLFSEGRTGAMEGGIRRLRSGEEGRGESGVGGSDSRLLLAYKDPFLVDGSQQSTPSRRSSFGTSIGGSFASARSSYGSSVSLSSSLNASRMGSIGESASVAAFTASGAAHKPGSTINAASVSRHGSAGKGLRGSFSNPTMVPPSTSARRRSAAAAQQFKQQQVLYARDPNLPQSPMAGSGSPLVPMLMKLPHLGESSRRLYESAHK